MKHSKSHKPPFFRMIGRVDLREGNLSEKLRIGTLPIEELLALQVSEMHTVSPARFALPLPEAARWKEQCIRQIMHNVRVCLMLCGAAGYWHLHHLSFPSSKAKPKGLPALGREENHPKKTARGRKKSSQGKARLIP
ncbi:MAG: hypothetical protein AAF149_24570, partial [Bacteroidota bacterium]